MSAVLRVVVSEHAVQKLALPNGIPSKVEELQSKVRETFKITGDFCLHYKDTDFGDEFFSLLSTSDIKDKDTIKIVYIQEPTITLTLSSVDESLPSTSEFSPQAASQASSVSSNDTLPVTPPPVNQRSKHWPVDFPIPRFSSTTETILSAGNEIYSSSGALLNSKEFMAILPDVQSHLAEAIFEYTAYPESAHFSQVAAALVQRHPCLKEPGSFNGCYGWIQRLKHKMSAFRSKLRDVGYPELAVNSLKRKGANDQAPAKNVKKPKKAEVNYLPPHPEGETSASLEKERQELLTEVTKKESPVIAEKMARTFSLRRQEILFEEPLVSDFMKRWPGLFSPSQLNEEFKRITTESLEATFMAQLDLCTSRLMELVSRRGGDPGIKIRQIKDRLLQCNTVDARREAAIRCLVVYLGEKEDELFKHFHDTEEFEENLKTMIMNIAIIGDDHSEARTGAIVIEGSKVIQEKNIPRCCALLMGVIYALNLTYKKQLKFTFEVFQKCFLKLDTTKTSPKILKLKNSIF